MAIPLYNIGTATLTKGSAVMTGQGTQWQGSVRPYDQVVGFDGSKAFVQSVNSNTSITLTRAWQGVAQAAQPYDILFTSDAAFLQEEARAVFAELRASALLKLGAVPPAARKLVHFNATADAALSDLSDFGLTLLDDIDAAAARATLLLGGYATLNPGAFGWGADNANVGVPNNNADTLNLNGVYRIISSTVGFPFIGGGVAQLIHMGQAANVAVQVAFSASTTETQANYAFAVTRTRNTSGVWSSWRPVGSMSGSNANGTYVRFADGTQICSNPDITMTRTSSPTMTGAWSYPSIFVSGSSPVVTFTVSDVLPASNRECSQRVGASALTASIQLLQNGSWPTDLTLSARAIAIGRWF